MPKSKLKLIPKRASVRGDAVPLVVREASSSGSGFASPVALSFVKPVA